VHPVGQDPPAFTTLLSTDAKSVLPLTFVRTVGGMVNARIAAVEYTAIMGAKDPHAKSAKEVRASDGLLGSRETPQVFGRRHTAALLDSVKYRK
jgi:hypothetical protein